MNLRQLRAFQSVAETGSFTAAARRLRLSQSAVSRRIQLLEEDLGVSLFKRVSGRVYLTPAGERMIGHSRPILQRITKLVKDVRSHDATSSGCLRLGGEPFACTWIFPPLLQRFHRIAPENHVSIVSGSRAEILRALKSDQIDLGLASLPVSTRELKLSPALLEEWVAVLPQDHPLASRPRLRLQEMSSFPFVHLRIGSDTRAEVDRVCSQRQVRLRGSFEAADLETARQLVAHGLGLSILPGRSLAEADRAGLCCRAVADAPIQRELAWMQLKERFVPPAARRLLEVFFSMPEAFRPRPERLP